MTDLIPRLISTSIRTEDPFIYLCDVTDFGADPAGIQDSTGAIRASLDAVATAGGGTVRMPHGKYRITENIKIPHMVTLRGDGEVILLLDIPSEDCEDRGTFTLSEDASLQDLIFYYPHQSADAPVAYPFTVSFGNGCLASLRRCTFINAYRGIGTYGCHEMLMLKDIRGTFLKCGVFIHNSSDVGTINGLTVSPEFWAKYDGIDAERIARTAKANDSCGLKITDAEQQQYLNVRIEGVTRGILLPCISTRWMGAGSFYNLHISNCVDGFYVEGGTYKSLTHASSELTNIDYRWGYNIVRGEISAERYAIYNGSIPIGGKCARIKIAGVMTAGRMAGFIEETTRDADVHSPDTDTHRKVFRPAALFTVRAGGNEEDIQAVLDHCAEAGGGIVYVPAGNYYIRKGLTVRENVLLCGAAGSALRHADAGTVFYCELDAIRIEDIDTKPPVIELCGRQAGVRGIFFMYRDNILNIDSDSVYAVYPRTVSGYADDLSIYDCCIAGASHGVYLNGARYTVKNLVCCCISESVRVCGDDGLLCDNLQNATVLYRTHALPVKESNRIFSAYFDPIGRKNTVFIRVGEGRGQRLFNNFIYGGRDVLHLYGTENAAVMNIGGDNIGNKGCGVFVRAYSGSADICGLLRYNGTSYENNGCRLRIFARMGINEADEPDLV